MGRLKKIAEKFLKNPAELKSGNGLYASLDELMSMRRYASYLKFGKLNKTFSNQAGEIRSAFKGRGIELEELREYGFGDDVRDIDWRVTARKEKPYTRVYLEEKDKEVYVWLDLSPLMLFGSLKELKSVTAAKTAALLGWFSLINKDRFGCVVFDGHKSWMFKAKNDRAYLAAMLKKISALSEEALSSKSFDDSERQKSLKLLQKNVKSKANVFLISSFDSWLTDFQADIVSLAGSTRLYLVNVFDSLERKAPPYGQYMAEWNGEKIVFESSSKSYRRAYADYFSARHKKMKDFCRKFGCHFLELSAETNFIGGLKIF